MKKEKKSKKFLSTLLSISMLSTLAVFPLSAEAATSAIADGIAENKGVALNWNKHLRDNGDGTYTLTFAAKSEISHIAMNTDIYTAEKGVYTVPADGKYIVQAWGGNGGKGSDVNVALIGTNMKEGGKGGAGGFVEGTLELKKGQKIAYDIGSNGSTTQATGDGGGVNGDGGTHGGYGSYGIGGGGGYTAVYVYDETAPVEYKHTDNYVLVAGGGGGGGAGHRSQSYTPDGGKAGDMNTSANAELTADQNNGVAGTYYAGSNGHSNSDNDEYVGYGATNMPGESNSSIFGWISASSGNDWYATYNPDREAGVGGDGNGRGGAGGAGFAGGGGGIQHNVITAWDCGGGGGGSSFIAQSVTGVDDKYREYLLTENASTTGGCVAILHVIENMEEIATLSSVKVEGNVSEYFDIVGATDNVQRENGAFTVSEANLIPAELSAAQTATDVATLSITVKPKTGFAGGNNVPLLKDIKISNEKYTFNIGENTDTDFVNVPWMHKITANTVYTEKGETVNTKDLYVDDNIQSKVGTSGYEFIKEITLYAVEGISDETFPAPQETKRYKVSYKVTATNSAAKVGTPVDGEVSAEAIVDVSGMTYVNVDGSKNGYKKVLKSKADGTYDLVIEHNIDVAADVVGDAVYTDNIELVKEATTAGTDSYTIPNDGYYLILLRGADGGDGGDTSVAGLTTEHRHGYGGAGADGGYAYMLGKFSANEALELQIGSKPEDAEDSIVRSIGDVETQSEGGKAGGNTTVSQGGSVLAIAGGGGGGGGAFSRQIVRGTDVRAHGYAAKQNVGFEVSSIFSIEEATATNGQKGSQSEVSGVIFAAGNSGKSYVYEPYSVENFVFIEEYYNSIKTTDRFKELINVEDIAAETSRKHACSTADDSEEQPLESFTQAHKELTQLKDTAGVKIYKITRTKNQTAYNNYTSDLNLSGEISKYFTINDVTVTGAKAGYNATYTNGAENETSTFSVSNVTQTGNDNIVYTINLSPRDGFLGGNDVPTLNSAKFTRAGRTEDTSDDEGILEAKASSDYANVAIPTDFDFELETQDKTIVKGESVNVSELVKKVATAPTGWKADYVELKSTLSGTNGEATVSPVVTTEYILSAELAPKTASTKAVVAAEAESVKQSKPATVYVEYSVTYDVTNITPSNNDNAQYKEAYTTILNSNGYALPQTITVTMGDKTLTKDTDYTYSAKTGRVYINENVIDDNITITAAATDKKYTLTYVAYTKDGSQIAKTNAIEYTIGDEIDRTWENEYTEKANKTADVGYEFKWNWQTADGKALDTMPGNDVFVEGSYGKKAYKLTINYVTPSGVTAPSQYVQEIEWGEDYSVNSPTVAGHIADKATVSGTMPKNDVTVTVTYEAIPEAEYLLTINYVYENGTTAADSYTATLKESEEYNVDSPNVTGYKPDQKTVSVKMENKPVTITVTYKEDVTPITVTFDAQGGSLAKGDETKTVYFGNSRKYGTLPTPVKSGAKFLGWFTDVTGGTEVKSTTVVGNPTDHTLYAHWESITADVIYYANGGKFTNDRTEITVTGEYGKAYPQAGETPSRGNSQVQYTFLGWFTDAEATNAFDPTKATFAYSSPRKLYAGWKIDDSAEVIFKNGEVVLEKYPFEILGTLTKTIPTPPTAGGYFKGWFDEAKKAGTLTIDYYEKKKGNNSFTVTDNTGTDPFLLTYLANWYDTTAMGKTCISDARAQAVTLNNGKYIRFLALIDTGYADYQTAGFVLSTECPTPTKEAGYQYSTQGTFYKKIIAMNKDNGEKTWFDIAYLAQSDFGFENGAGILYTNLKIKEGKEDTVYYATPYIVKNDGTYVYGKTKAISYNQLKANDAVVLAKNK